MTCSGHRYHLFNQHLLMIWEILANIFLFDTSQLEELEVGVHIRLVVTSNYCI